MNSSASPLHPAVAAAWVQVALGLLRQLLARCHPCPASQQVALEVPAAAALGQLQACTAADVTVKRLERTILLTSVKAMYM